MNWNFTIVSLLCFAFIFPTIFAQDYAEFARGAGMARRRNNRGPLAVAVLSSLFGGLVGSWYTGRRMNFKQEKNKKELLQYIQMQDEIYKQREKQWSKEYQKLYEAYKDLENEKVERDYEEFKAPDTNDDDMISREEFNTYVRKYLASFPELSEKDFPKFEEFDLNHDGIVSFEEWQQFLTQQKLQEAKKSKSEKNPNSAYQELLNALYEQSYQSDSFNSLNKAIGSNSKGKAAAVRGRGN